MYTTDTYLGGFTGLQVYILTNYLSHDEIISYSTTFFIGLQVYVIATEFSLRFLLSS